MPNELSKNDNQTRKIILNTHIVVVGAIVKDVPGLARKTNDLRAT